MSFFADGTFFLCQLRKKKKMIEEEEDTFANTERDVFGAHFSGLGQTFCLACVLLPQVAHDYQRFLDSGEIYHLRVPR